MAHYAFIKGNLVVEVIPGRDETDIADLPEEFSNWEEYYATKRPGTICKRTSYNTIENTHINEGAAFRGNYAGVGYVYDEIKDVFYPPAPHDSWILDETIWNWKPPVELPADYTEVAYRFNNETQSWEEDIS
jgi:hypothetical protein